jgi:pyridoxal phosphate enzyme (YggS family)
MIGHLQKNKVKHISKFISLIHSLDRLSLAKEIDKNGRKDNRSIDCLIQIKISNDESKYGLNPEQLDSFYADLKEFENINIIGLMAMATYTKDQSLIADEFKKMEKLFKEMKTIDSNFKILSIGMSDDYQLAINNGSNMIRVGSKIFGQRNY